MKGLFVAKFDIVGTQEDWSVEAATYRVTDDFFHFYSGGGEQLFAVRKEYVVTVRSSLADQN